MNKLMPYVAGVFFALFGFGVIALLFSYTFSALAYVFPDNLFAQMMGMVLFDIAAIAWLLALIYLCKSVMQYAFSFIGFVFGLTGSLAMVAMEVMLGGQELMEAPSWVNEALIYGFIIAAVVHVVLYYSFKLSAPEISADISLGFETAQITDEAMKQAEAQLLQQRGALGGVIAPRLITNVKRNLGLPVSQSVIDAPAWVNIPEETPIPVQIPQVMPTETNAPRQKAPSFFDRVRAAGQALINPNALQHGPRNYSANTQAVDMPTSPAQVKPEPTAPQESAQTMPTPINVFDGRMFAYKCPGCGWELKTPTKFADKKPCLNCDGFIELQDVSRPQQHIEPQYHPMGMTPIEAPTSTAKAPQESEAAEVQAVPLPFSGNGNGKHPHQ